MTEIPRTPPSSDAELVARVEQATRPLPLAAAERARFAARVRERVAGKRSRGVRWAPLAALAGLTGAIALVVALTTPATQPATPAPDAAATLAVPSLADSWQEELLYAPEWIESDDGFVDAEVLPESYAAASALLEP